MGALILKSLDTSLSTDGAYVRYMDDWVILTKTRNQLRGVVKKMHRGDNPANSVAHFETTGPELWDQTEGKITHFVATSGTGGTISGTARYLKDKNPDIKVIGVDPFGSVYYKYFFTREFDSKEIYPYVTEGVGEDILAGMKRGARSNHSLLTP